jgi:hypothetical protein
MLSMSKLSTISLLLFFCLLGFLGCSGPEEGVYTGKIGTKKAVTIRIKTDGLVELEGYWKQPLQGGHDKGSLKGKDMHALVFEGPVGKKFKLRFLYEMEGESLVIRAIHSRTYGPGARYIPTEEDSALNPAPRLSRLSPGKN